MWILNQSKDLFLDVAAIKLKGAKIVGVNQHQANVTLGKYNSPEHAQSVMQSLVAHIKNTDKFVAVFEMPA